MLFRAFEVEGYMISTGSMAPTLLGFHKRVICPACGCQFPFGVAFDESNDDEDHGEHSPHNGSPAPAGRAAASAEAHHDPHQLATCPNCGLDAIDVSDVPRNQGDQLLVNKSAYDLRNPRRWEVVVFRNPYRASQAYVKRIAGLPGEKIQVIDGDVYADGHICRKPFDLQCALRIPVFDNAHRPANDPDWRPRWAPDDPDSPWKPAGSGFVLSAASANDAPSDPDEPDSHHAQRDSWSWVTYTHWLREGGSHRTSVVVGTEAGEVHVPAEIFSPVQYNRATRTLTCTGVLTSQRRAMLLAFNKHPAAEAAIERLYEESHQSPVIDAYGYNRPDAGIAALSVRDLMFEAEIEVTGGQGEFVVEMTDGRQKFDALLDVSRREARLYVDGERTPVRTAPLEAEWLARPITVTMSLCDRQVVLAIDGAPLFEPWLLAEGPTPSHEPARHPARFAARGLSVRVPTLALYRDVHYTRGRARHGIDSPCALGPGEYFMLGDNSPVSADSRNWPDGRVPAHLLLGQPFLVHLPSRPGRIQFAGMVRYFRIPDFSRMRYIR